MMLIDYIAFILVWGGLASLLIGWISRREQFACNVLAVTIWMAEDVMTGERGKLVMDIVMLVLNAWLYFFFDDDDRPRKRRKKYLSAKGAAIKAKLKSFAPSPLPSPAT